MTVGLALEPTDAELVAGCRHGDPRAWNALVERFSRYVFAIATQAFRLSEHDAEDVFQDVFAKTYERLG
jgi:DNA-directed RNA polymerase specialized sigma24 family protein